MIRKIIKIDQDKCNGCGLCAQACHEGAIGMKDGKAVLLRDDYCDGLGDCLPVCPTNAISFEEREALEYDHAAVQLNMARKQRPQMGCPGSRVQTIPPAASADGPIAAVPPASQLNQWPVQIKLVPVNAPYFEQANLLIAADCTAYAYANFHQQFMKGKVTLIGCPKLDEGDYSEKLTAIIEANQLQSITVVRMEVPCCGGIEYAVKTALKNSGSKLPCQVITVGINGTILS